MEESEKGPVSVLITYRIREGISREEYRKWSRERDQPIASSFPEIRRYEIFEVHGADEGEPWTDIVEWIEVDSWETWLEVDQSPKMSDVLQEFLQISQPGTVQTVYARKIEP